MGLYSICLLWFILLSMMLWLSFPVWVGGRSVGRASKTVPKSGKPIPSWVCWSNCTTVLVLLISKSAGCDCYMDPAGGNLVCQDLSAGHFEPLPTFSIRFRWWLSLQIPLQSLWGDTRVEAPNRQPTMLGEMNH